MDAPAPAEDRIGRWLDRGALALLGAAFAWLLAVGSGIDAWRHDSLYYIGDFGPKAMLNGRWLAALLWRPSIVLPGVVTWWLGYLALAAFAFRVAQVNGLDRVAAALFALLIVQIPCVLGQSLWPASTLPGPLLLVVAAAVHGRLPAPVFYLAFGLLFFGVSQHYYFLLPLLDLPRIFRARSPSTVDALLVLAIWTGGFLLGAGFAYLLVFEIIGSERAPIPDWREPNLVTDVGSLLANLGSRARYVAEHLGILGGLSFGGLPLIALALAWASSQSADRIVARLLVCASIAVAIHVATIAIGTKIDFRTALPLFFAALAFAFLGPTSHWHRRLLPVAAVLVGLPFTAVNLENLRWYRGVTEAYRDALVQVAPRPPSEFEGLLIAAGTAHRLQQQIERDIGLRARHIVPKLSEERGIDLRFRPAALAAGFARVRFCAGRRCPPFERKACGPGPICAHGTSPDGDLIVTLTGGGSSEAAGPAPGSARPATRHDAAPPFAPAR